MPLLYFVAVIANIFAYLWLLFILEIHTPNEIEVWESIVTVLFYPIVVITAFSADKGWLHFLICCKESGTGTANMTDKQRQIELDSFQPGESK